jgi:hypothetical protein
MKTRMVEILMLIAIGIMVEGCAAVIPLLPMMASVPGLLMTPVGYRKSRRLRWLAVPLAQLRQRPHQN